MAQAWFTLLVGFVAASIAVWGIITQRAIELAKQKDGLSPWSSEDCEKSAEV
jgi:hypothetical protein